MQTPFRPKSFPGLIFLLILAILAAANPARADEADDQYLDILNLIEAADALTNGPPAPAFAKYREAQTALYNFTQAYPKWNDKAVAFRVRYVSEKSDAFKEKAKLAATAAASAAEAKSAGPQIKLLEAGTEPRVVLRLHPKVGDKQTLNMLLKMAMDMKAGEMEAPPNKMPRMSMTMNVSITALSADGDITYELLMSDAGVDEDAEANPLIVAAMKSALAGFKGVSGTATMSNRGLPKSTELKLPPDATAQTRQMADNMKESLSTAVIPLPEEAVGPGAKWEVKQKRNSQGLTLDETATIELVTVENDRLTAKVTIDQHAANQKIQNPAMPGMKADLDKMVGNGAGAFTLDLSQLLPPEVTSDLHTELSMVIDAAGQKQPMTMKMDVGIRMESK